MVLEEVNQLILLFWVFGQCEVVCFVPEVATQKMVLGANSWTLLVEENYSSCQ